MRATWNVPSARTIRIGTTSANSTAMFPSAAQRKPRSSFIIMCLLEQRGPHEVAVFGNGGVRQIADVAVAGKCQAVHNDQRRTEVGLRAPGIGDRLPVQGEEHAHAHDASSEERRVGEEGVSKFVCRWAAVD